MTVTNSKTLVDLYNALEDFLSSEEATRMHKYGSMACIYGQGLLEGVRAEMRRVWQDGLCPACYGYNLKNKGSTDKCMDCSLSITVDMVGEEAP
jgi:hypothetical protein